MSNDDWKYIGFTGWSERCDHMGGAEFTVSLSHCFLSSKRHAGRLTVQLNFFIFSNFIGCVAVVASVFSPKANLNLIILVHFPDLASIVHLASIGFGLFRFL